MPQQSPQPFVKYRGVRFAPRDRRDPNAVEIHIGRRLRERRVLRRLTQAQLARRIGISLQQIQKYECGINRIVASRLWALGRALDCPIATFFEDITAVGSAKGIEFPAQDGRAPNWAIGTLNLVRAYAAITPPLVRENLLNLTRLLGAAAATAPASPHAPVLSVGDTASPQA
jgi:transcriptional regulator with XRE-family HTH domain